MKVQRVSFRGVAGLPDRTLDFTDARTGAPHAVVVLTGPSGAGKTRVLDAIAAAKEGIRPYGLQATGAAFVGAAGTAKVALTFHLDESERDFAGSASPTMDAEVLFHPDRVEAQVDDGLRAVLGRFSHNPAYGKVDYFPAERRVPTFPPFPGLGPAEQRVLRMGKDPRKYGSVLPFLRTLDHEADRRERFAAALASLAPALRFVADTSGQVLPLCFSRRGGAPMSVTSLSHAETDAVLFAATATLVGLDHSLVLVDRPDLHADDPGAFVAALAGLGRDNQLVLGMKPGSAAAVSGAHVVSLDAA
jgi:hypothetical protein